MKKMLLLLSLAIIASGCSTNVKKNVDKKMENVSINDDKALQSEVRKAITESKHITEEQKTKLLALDDKFATEQKQIKEELTKAKVVLLELIAKKDLNKKELNAVKSKIAKLNEKRVVKGFMVADEVRDIIFPKETKKSQKTPEEIKIEQDMQREIYYMIYRHQIHDL